FLVERGELPKCTGKKAQKSQSRTVQRWLKKEGYKTGRRRGRATVDEQTRIAAWRDRYLDELAKNESAPPHEQYRLVCIDESYAHQHLHCLDTALHNPSDK